MDHEESQDEILRIQDADQDNSPTLTSNMGTGGNFVGHPLNPPKTTVKNSGGIYD